MISSFFNELIYIPLYNGLVFLMDVIPWADAGVIVILFTFLVKFTLFPLSKKAVSAQMKLKKLEPELEKVKNKYKDDKQEQAKQIMAFYKEQNINPFSSIFLLLIQLPIIFALYYIFLKAGLPDINGDLLYSFVRVPEIVDINFLGFIDISGKSYILAILAAISSFFQIRLSMPPLKPKTSNPSFKDDLARNMNIQMRYFFPVMVFFISYNISGAIALYWLTSNLFTIGQEIFVKRKMQLQFDDKTK